MPKPAHLSSVLVASMARTIIDCGVHPFNDRDVILCLIGAGWNAKAVELHMDAAMRKAGQEKYGSKAAA